MDRDARDEELAKKAGLSLAEAERIVANLPERDRIAAAAWACETLRRNWRRKGTYRALLAALGIEKAKTADAYRLLMAAGGLDLNNALTELDQMRGTSPRTDE
jgi:hypothetical protein